MSRIRSRARLGIRCTKPNRSWLESRKPIPRPMPVSNDKISRYDKRLAAIDTVGQISRKKLGERRDAFRQSLNQSQLRRPRTQRNQKRRQHPVRHLRGCVVQKRRDAEGVDVAGGGWLRLRETLGHRKVLPRRHTCMEKDQEQSEKTGSREEPERALKTSRS